MKTTDLMIGDFVTFADCQREEFPTICEIAGIEPNEVFVYIDEDKSACDEVDAEELVGIRLTPEILEKNGWERLTTDENESWGMEVLQYNEEQHLVYILNCRFDTWQPHLSIRSFTPEYGTFEMFDICFVHELQHALKLCGIEKTIEL